MPYHYIDCIFVQVNLNLVRFCNPLASNLYVQVYPIQNASSGQTRSKVLTLVKPADKYSHLTRQLCLQLAPGSFFCLQVHFGRIVIKIITEV